MTRKSKKKPLTGKDLADMDYKHETSKAKLIKDRGITATVTPPMLGGGDEPSFMGLSLNQLLGIEQPPQRSLTADEIKAEDEAYKLLAASDRYVVATKDRWDDAKESYYAGGFDEGLEAPRTEGELRAEQQAAKVIDILREVNQETLSALTKHGPQHNPHEGYAVLLEELDELWDEIKANRGRQGSARKEAVQVAAMAVRYILDNQPR